MRYVYHVISSYDSQKVRVRQRVMGITRHMRKFLLMVVKKKKNYSSPLDWMIDTVHVDLHVLNLKNTVDVIFTLFDLALCA